MKRNRTTRFLILIVLAGLVFLILSESSTQQSEEPTTAQASANSLVYLPMVYKPVNHAPRARYTWTEPQEYNPIEQPTVIVVDPLPEDPPVVIEPDPDPQDEETCGHWYEPGPHPCPGGCGYGLQNGNADIKADPQPEPQRNGK